MKQMSTNKIVIATSALSGILFSFGLLLAGMANPAKVLGFLDIAGTWDPSLMFVMIGAIAVVSPAFYLMKNRENSLLGQEMQIPKNKSIEKSLLVGSLLFGAGWGLAGICPGPSLLLLGMGLVKGVVFVTFMLIGMYIFSVFNKQ